MKQNTTTTKDDNRTVETDLQKDQNLYDLKHCDNLSKMTGEQVFYGGHNLYRIYDEDGEKISYLNKQEMKDCVEEFVDAVTAMKFRQFWSESE